MKKIIIRGVEYPCYVTMGALLRFKRETGKDFSQIAQDDIEAVLTFFWCCAVSACAKEGTEFPFGLLAFADELDPSAMETFVTGLAEDSGDSKKK